MTDFIDNRNYSDRRQYDIGYGIIDGVRVNRRIADRRISDQVKRKFKEILDKSTDETISDQQVQNLLNPVLQMIRNGEITQDDCENEKVLVELEH